MSKSFYTPKKFRFPGFGGVVVLTLIFGCWYPGWWLNQPIWKICSWNWIISPGIRGDNSKNIWVATTLEHIKTLLLPPNLRHYPIFSLFASAGPLGPEMPFSQRADCWYASIHGLPKHRIRWDLFGSPKGCEKYPWKICTYLAWN